MENNWTACYQCNRGGNGNDKDLCSCGWKHTTDNSLGCYVGTSIVGKPKQHKKLTKSQERYKKYLSVADCFESFFQFLKYESMQKAGAN
jgi:hypothetical protein